MLLTVAEFILMDEGVEDSKMVDSGRDLFGSNSLLSFSVTESKMFRRLTQWHQRRYEQETKTQGVKYEP